MQTDPSGAPAARPSIDRGSRILVVAESFLPAVNGVTNSVLRVVEQLDRRGHEVRVVAPGPTVPRLGRVRVSGVASVSVPRAGPLRVGVGVRKLEREIRAFEPDVVHLAAPFALGASALRIAQQAAIPTVAVYQTDLAGFASRHGFEPARRPLWRWLRHLHDRADLTLAPSSSAVWALRANGIERVARWGRGVDLDRFSPRHRDQRLRRWWAPEAQTIVGYVGRLAREKQVERLAPLCGVEGLSVIVVGDGPERRRLERLLPGATFTGQLTGPALSRAHASLDVFAHAGLDETFCQAVQEAMASGVPVVAPACGGPLDLVAHGTTGSLWIPTEPASFPAAIRELADDPVRRAEMGVAARRAVAERSWSAVVDELIGHYASVAPGICTDLGQPRRAA